MRLQNGYESIVPYRKRVGQFNRCIIENKNVEKFTNSFQFGKLYRHFMHKMAPQRWIYSTLFLLWKMVFCYQNCSDLLWEKIVLVIEKDFWNLRLKAENLQIFETTKSVGSNSERSEQYLVTECFFNLFLEVFQT